MTEEILYTVRLGAFEAGVLLSFLSRMKDDPAVRKLGALKQQLIMIAKRIQKEAGVTVEKLPDGRIKMTDQDGNVIVREPREWEKYG